MFVSICFSFSSFFFACLVFLLWLFVCWTCAKNGSWYFRQSDRSVILLENPNTTQHSTTNECVINKNRLFFGIFSHCEACLEASLSRTSIWYVFFVQRPKWLKLPGNCSRDHTLTLTHTKLWNLLRLCNS